MNDISPLVRSKMPCVEPEDRVSRVALLMSRTRSNVVMVRKEGSLLGAVMRKQLLRPPLSPDTKAERLLIHPPILSPGTSVDDAIALVIQSGCDSLPVCDGDLHLGTVLARDLARELGILEGKMRGLTVAGVPAMGESQTIAEAAGKLREHDLESLPVVDRSGDLQGWASFQDIHRYVLAPERGIRGTGEFVGEKLHPMRNPVASILSSQGVTAQLNTGIGEAVGILTAKKINELTVMEGRKVICQLSILGMLSGLAEGPSEIMVQTAGMEGEDPFEVRQVITNLETTARKIRRICGRMQTPEIRVKTYEHRGSSRKRYEVRVTFHVPEQYVSEARGWDLLSVCQQATKKAEIEILRGRSRVIDAHRRRRGRPPEEA